MSNSVSRFFTAIFHFFSTPFRGSAKVQPAENASPPVISLTDDERRADMNAWLQQFKNLEAINATEDIPAQRRGMYISWRAWNPAFTPLVQELHDFLSRILLDMEGYPESLQEAHYAVQAAPHIPLLQQRLCLVQLENNDLEGASQTLQKLLAQNPDLLESSEVASLKGRLHRMLWQQNHQRADLDAAQEAYTFGFEHNPESYYLRLNAAELMIPQGRVTESEAEFKALDPVIRELIKTGRDASYWAHFSLGEAILGGASSHDAATARAALDEYSYALNICKPPPADRNWRSARDGAQRIVAFKNLDPKIYDNIQALRPLP